MKAFVCLDIILLASGCKVYRRNIFLKILDMIMLLLIIVCYGATLFSTIRETKENGGNVMLGMMERYSHEIFGLIFICIVRNNRNNIQHILKTVSPSLSAKQKISLKRHSAFCLFMIIMTIAQEAVFTRFHLQANSFGKIDQAHIIRDWLKCYHSMNSWLLGGCCVFAFLVKIIKFNEENYFNNLEQNASDMIPENSSRLVIERKSVIIIRKTLLKCFGIIPCLWFLHVFVRAPVVVFQTNSDVPDLMEKAWSVLPLVYDLIAVGFVIYQCDTCSQLTKKRVNDITMILIKENRIETMGVFVGELERSADEDFTSWKTINMNRRFFFGFACSVVSFTILVLQTTKEIYGELPNGLAGLRTVAFSLPVPLNPENTTLLEIMPADG